MKLITKEIEKNLNDGEKKFWAIRVPTGETLMEFKTVDKAQDQVVKYIIDDFFSKDEENKTKYKANFYSIYLNPRNKEYEKDIPAVYEILKKGSEKARSVASATLLDVKSAMKINYFDDVELIKEQSERFH